MFDAFVAEARAAPMEQMRMIRLGVRLTPAEHEELHERLHALLDEYAQREPASGGEPWSLFYAAHPDPRPVGDPADRTETSVPMTTPRDTIEDDD
jgi:hypothetical protein